MRFDSSSNLYYPLTYSPILFVDYLWTRDCHNIPTLQTSLIGPLSPLLNIMKLVPLILLAWAHIKPISSLPIEDTLGFTPWPIEKRGIIPEDIFSNAKFGAKFAVKDDTCRGKLPGNDGKCWTMMDATVDVSNPENLGNAHLQLLLTSPDISRKSSGKDKRLHGAMSLLHSGLIRCSRKREQLRIEGSPRHSCYRRTS